MRHDVLVIGGGPAGLATSAALTREAIEHRVLERGEQIGNTWEHLYDGLVLHTAKALSSLPGMRFPASAARFPTRRDFLDYLHRYAETFQVPVETRTEVTSVGREGGDWVVGTAAGTEFRARALVVATGIVANPYEPVFSDRDGFRGRAFHSVNYRRPEPFTGQRVLVVGAGNSAGEITMELAQAGAAVTLAVRSGATIVPREIAGVPIQYLSLAVGALPKGVQRLATSLMGQISALVRGRPPLPPPPPSACPRVPLIGLHLADALRSGAVALQGGLAAFTSSGVRFDDGSEAPFDTVILATGYRAALGPLGSLVQLDSCGFARRRDRVTSSDQDRLYFVGHNYGIQGGLFNIGRDARLAARHIKAGGVGL